MLLVVHANTPETTIQQLQAMGYQVIRSMKCRALPDTVAEHPDMQIHLLRDDLAIVPPECYSYYRAKLPDSVELLLGESELTGTYPGDCAYNVARIKNTVFCNLKAVDPKLLAYYQGEGFSIIHNNQGYTKCNMAVIGNEVVVTEDIGIHKTIIANKLQIDSVYIPKGEVKLPGFPYGFIGGACGGWDHTLFWYGNPMSCSYYGTIEMMCENIGVKNISLFKGSLYDMGGIICIPL